MVDVTQGPTPNLVRIGRESAARDDRLIAASTPHAHAVLDAAALEWAMGDNDVAAGIIAEAIAQAEAATIANVVAWLREKEGAWRLIINNHMEVGAPHIPRILATALENGDWRNG